MPNIQCVFISIMCFCFFGCTNTPNELTIAEQFIITTPDSALNILQKINGNTLNGNYNRALYALLLSQALDKNEINVESDSLISIATNYFDNSDPVRAGFAWFYHARTARNRGDLNEQADNLLKAQEFAEISLDNLLLGDVNYDKASMLFKQKQFNYAIKYFKTATDYYKQISDRKGIILSYLYIGYSYLYMSKIDSAQMYYKQAEKYSEKITDKIMISVILKNIGTVYFQQNNYKLALRYYHKVPLTNNKSYDSNKYYLIADVYIRTNKLDSAKYYLNKVNETHEIAPDYYRLWQAIAEQENDKSKALFYANKVNYVTDSIYKNKLEISFAGLEKKYKYLGLQIKNQKLLIRNKQNEILLVLALLALALIFVVILIWRLWVKRREANFQRDIANKNQKLFEKEKENTAKEKENSALLEMQVRLQSILLLNLEQHRDNAVKQPGIWKNKKKELKSGLNKSFNEELIACMNIEYNNITQRLSANYPELSNTDLITCCLILAGFETGMIATVFDVHNESVFIRRSRIRKKLKIEESENLVQFLRHF